MYLMSEDLYSLALTFICPTLLLKGYDMHVITSSLVNSSDMFRPNGFFFRGACVFEVTAFTELACTTGLCNGPAC